MSGLLDRLRFALARAPAVPLSPGDDHARPGTPTPAAVLIALTERPAPGLLLTVRQPHLRRHAGQIALPGGRIDPVDRDPPAAALREAEEEIGLDRNMVRLAGQLPAYLTGSGYLITPVVGVVPPDLPLRPQEAEVAAWFEVPWAFLADPANRRQGSRTFDDRLHRFFELSWEDRRIWGITAALIVNLSHQLGARW